MRAQPGDAVRLPWRWRPWLATFVLAAGAVGLAALPNPQEARAQRRAAEKAAVAEAARQIEAEGRELAATPGPANAAVAEDLARLAEQLRQAEELDDAARLLEDAQADLSARVALAC